jgi:hypothetical protein
LLPPPGVEVDQHAHIILVQYTTTCYYYTPIAFDPLFDPPPTPPPPPPPPSDSFLRYYYTTVFCQQELDESGVPIDKRLVAKLSRTDQSASMYFRDVEMQAWCQWFSKKYNMCHPPKKVEFLDAWVVELSDRESLGWWRRDYEKENTGKGSRSIYSEGSCTFKTNTQKQAKKVLCGVEEMISGEYHKWMDNTGNIDDLRNTPHAFAHFTYEASGQQMMVVDIQGVADMYTDPQVHTGNTRMFGRGNMGEKGFEQFWETHRCNAVCQFLGLPLVNPKEEDEDNGTAVREDVKSTSNFVPVKIQGPSTSSHLPITAGSTQASSVTEKDRWKAALRPNGPPLIKEYCWNSQHLVDGEYLKGISPACRERHCQRRVERNYQRSGSLRELEMSEEESNLTCRPCFGFNFCGIVRHSTFQFLSTNHPAPFDTK